MSTLTALTSPALLAGLPPESVIFGQSAAMQAVRRKVEKVANANVPVLIQGESGTGKEVLAKLLHHWSSWKSGPFVKVNCPAIPGTLLESELFGYEKGAFTGAYGSKPGRVELADRGTLFLDEIAELDPSMQAKLLQLLQDGQFCRIGAQEDKRVEVRVVCATNRNLEAEIEARTFRQDLFYRINVFNIQLPPLRERVADIPELVRYLLQLYSEKYNAPGSSLSQQALELMQQYHWPGNVRELENLIRRCVILGSEQAIGSGLLAKNQNDFSLVIPQDGSISLKKLTRQATLELEYKVILKVLEASRWNRKLAAGRLNISYRALLYKMKQAGMPPKRNGLAHRAAEAASAD